MADQWVLASQQWLNKTFGKASGWSTVTEDGYTGQNTVNGLIEGLQNLLGISPVVANFGPGTWSKLQAHGNVTSKDSVKWITLVQAALYCKGYTGGQLDGTWASTQSSVQQFSADLGLSSSVTGLTPKTFKALLTTDPAVLIAGGTSASRQAQQYLNKTYGGHDGFYYNATGGVFDRSTQQNLVRGIQYELGQSDAAADGAFGPGTGGQLKAATASVVRVGSTGKWVALFKAALNFNGYPVTFNSTFTSADSAVVKRFQQFEGFTAANQTGIGDYATWAELIVSTGDPNRPGTGADMASTITAARAQSLKAAGYTLVGRYLTNEQVSNPLDKKIKPGELDTIFSAGLRLFPIFEEGGYKTSWFTATQGTKDAQRAYDAAVAYGIPAGTTIYFAVDVDVIEAQVKANVIPYFAALNTKMNQLGGAYGIGIYGSRNTCTIISDAGLARTSYIAGLSTGFSGNLGYPLPKNWAFNQIQTLTVGSGSGAVEIDKNIVSGRDNGISSVNTSGNPLAQFFAYIDALQAYAQTWYDSGNATTTPDRLVLQYMRYEDYGSGEAGSYGGIDAAEWAVVAGQLDLGFIGYVDATGLQRPTSYTEPSSRHVSLSPSHFAAAIDGLLEHPLSGSGDVNLGEGAGWAGDFIQFVGLWVRNGRKDIDQYVEDNLFKPNSDGGFGQDDFIEDLDGWLVARQLRTGGGPVNAVIRNFYSDGGGYRSRFDDFFAQRFSGSDITALRVLNQALVPALNSAYGVFASALYTYFAKSGYHYTSDEAGQFAQGFLAAYKKYLLV